MQSAVSARQPMGIWKSSSEVAIAIGIGAGGRGGADLAFFRWGHVGVVVVAVDGLSVDVADNDVERVTRSHNSSFYNAQGRLWRIV